MDMHAWNPRLHRTDEIPIEGGGKIGVDAALHADLGGAGDPRLLRTVRDLVQGERVGLSVRLSLGERAEATPHVARVGEVDVPVADVRNLGADDVGAEIVRHSTER